MKENLSQKIRKYRESFSGRLFLSFAAISLIFFAIYFSVDLMRDRQSLRQNIANKGRMLSAILAFHARTGLFAENIDMLKSAVDSVIVSTDVDAIRICNSSNKLIYEYNDNGFPAEIFRELHAGEKFNEDQNQEGSGYSFAEPGYMLFSAPVLLDQVIYSDDTFFDTNDTSAKRQPIGHIHLAIDWRYHEKKIRRDFIYGISIGLVFILAGGMAIYWYIRKASKPLLKLAEEVRSFGEGKPFLIVPVKSNDEVGRLSMAFNDMVHSLQSKEEERQRLEMQFRQAQKMETVGIMAGGIAHDFRNILTAISGFSNLARISLEKDDPAREYVEHILTSSSRASALVQSLLAFSRQQIINPKAVDLNAIIRGLEKMVGCVIREDIVLSIDLSKERLVVMADTGQIEQIMINLCTNAMDAMPKGGTLSITTYQVQLDDGFFQKYAVTHPGAYGAISVADSGTGMNEETMSRIFDPFFTTKEVGRGTGLGLSSVYGIVKQHGGYVDVKSEVDRGSVFSVYLPIIHSDAGQQQSRATAELKRGTETVLVAEDDEEVRLYIHDILQLFGYKVIEAKDGDEAIQIIREQPDIDLLILDVVLPGKNGKEVFETARTLSSDIRALFMSGHPADIISKQGVLDEGVNFIAKPVTPEELLIRIRIILDSEDR